VKKAMRYSCTAVLLSLAWTACDAQHHLPTAGAAITTPVSTIDATGATASAPAQRLNPPTTIANAHFATLPPGAVLPTDDQCAAAVRPTAEIRAINNSANHTKGVPGATTGIYQRVTGNFTGTTYELIQWASCKWGFDEDAIRAQVAKESWWHQDNLGDWGTDASACPPGHGIGADGRAGQCPQSFGLLQVRYPYWQAAFPSAITSSAYNLDYALAARRNCFEGNETWLNQVPGGRAYAAGDLWGCMGLWFSGRWYTQDSVQYISDVQNYLAQRVWESADFAAG
jgi:autotransporter family porin